MTSQLAPVLVQRAEIQSKDHTPAPYISEIALSTRKMIFCCFDHRINPEQSLGLTEDDKAFLVRTASGTPARNLIDIMAIDALTGVSEIIVIKHTDCGASHMTNEKVRDHAIKHNPELEGKLNDFDFMTFTNIEDRARADVELIKAAPFIRKELRDNTSAFVFDIKTGKLTKVV